MCAIRYGASPKMIAASHAAGSDPVSRRASANAHSIDGTMAASSR